MKILIYLICILFLKTALSQNPVEPFLPEIFKEFPNVRDIAISPSGNEILFSAQSYMGNVSFILSIKKIKDEWKEPEITSFSGQYFDLEPFFSPDGLRVYFVSSRPNPYNIGKSENFDIWYVERKNDNASWSQPINMGNPINTEHNEFYPSIAENGNFYFTRDNPELKSKDDIYISKNLNGQLNTPIRLSDAVNTEGYEYNAFIAPDESFLIFGSYNREDGFGSGDLYVSYKQNDDWTEAQNMGEIINSAKMDYCPYVNTNSNKLYFTSKRDNTHTKFNQKLTLEDFKKELNKYDNGSSRIYTIDLGSLLKR